LRRHQKKIAELFGLNEQFLSKLINGKVVLTQNVLLQIAQRVGFDPHYFTASEALSYHDFQRGPEHVLSGKLGMSRLSQALLSAETVIRAELEGGDVHELAEQLAVEVLSLQAVLAAYQLLLTRDRDEQRRIAGPLAWAVRQLAFDAQRAPKPTHEERKTDRG
jgi:transcriptional regulator with XRE-family HTH domain